MPQHHMQHAAGPSGPAMTTSLEVPLLGQGEVVGSWLATPSGYQFVGYLLPFTQRGKTRPLDRRDMDECIIRPVVRRDETEPLFRVEPLDRACRHDRILPIFDEFLRL